LVCTVFFVAVGFSFFFLFCFVFFLYLPWHSRKTNIHKHIQSLPNWSFI
jgi:hypothetical protein